MQGASVDLHARRVFQGIGTAFLLFAGVCIIQLGFTLDAWLVQGKPNMVATVLGVAVVAVLLSAVSTVAFKWSRV